jgi:hypothetical protein
MDKCKQAFGSDKHAFVTSSNCDNPVMKGIN